MPGFTSPFGGSVGASPHIDLDFVNAIYWSAPGNAPSPMTVNRNSVAYIDNVAGVWTKFAANTLRRSDKGTLIEEGRTNYIRNNSMQGAVNGSPGVLPTNWDTSAPNGLTRTVQLATANGIDCLILTWSGTTTSAAPIQINFDTPTGIPVLTGMGTITYSFSSWVYTTATTGITTLSLTQQTLNSSGTVVGSTTSSDFHSVSTLTRQSLLTTPSLSSYIRGALITNSIASNTSVNFSVVVGWPQLELPLVKQGGGVWENYGSNSPTPMATSPIRTTGTTAVRQADRVSITSVPPFGYYFTASVQATPFMPTTDSIDQYLVSITDFNPNSQYAATVNWGLIRTFSTGKPGWLSGSTRTAIQTGAWAVNTAAKIAGAQSPNAQSGSFNGGTLATGTTGTDSTHPPGSINPMTVGIGCCNVADPYAGCQFNGYITRVTVWSQTRLDDAVVTNLTGSFYPELGFVQNSNPIGIVQAAVSSETVPLTPGTNKVTLRAPHAFRINSVAGSLSAAGTTATQVNVKINGASIFTGNELTIDANSRTSVGSTIVPNITTTVVAEDDEITFDIDVAGTAAVGLKVAIKGVYL